MATPSEQPQQLPTAVDTAARPNEIVPSIENIVATGILSDKIELSKLSKKAKNCEYNPKRFAACVLRIRDPRATALIFKSGKMVIMGAKSEEKAKVAADRFTVIIRKTGLQVKMKDFKIHNVVGCADVKFRIDLEELNMNHMASCKYDAEVFPGLTFRMQKPDVVLLVFHSGKVVLTKARERAHVLEAFQKIYPVLLSYKTDKKPEKSK